LFREYTVYQVILNTKTRFALESANTTVTSVVNGYSVLPTEGAESNCGNRNTVTQTLTSRIQVRSEIVGLTKRCGEMRRTTKGASV